MTFLLQGEEIEWLHTGVLGGSISERSIEATGSTFKESSGFDDYNKIWYRAILNKNITTLVKIWNPSEGPVISLLVLITGKEFKNKTFQSCTWTDSSIHVYVATLTLTYKEDRKLHLSVSSPTDRDDGPAAGFWLGEDSVCSFGRCFLPCISKTAQIRVSKENGSDLIPSRLYAILHWRTNLAAVPPQYNTIQSITLEGIGGYCKPLRIGHRLVSLQNT